MEAKNILEWFPTFYAVAAAAIVAVVAVVVVVVSFIFFFKNVLQCVNRFALSENDYLK
jgi:hypothetical protein